MTRAASSAEARALSERVVEVLHHLAVVIRNSHFHDLSNEVFREPLDRLCGALGWILDHESELRLERVGSELFANRQRVRMALSSSMSYRMVVEELSAKGLGGIVVERGASEHDIRALVAGLAAAPANGHAEGGGDGSDPLNRSLAALGVVKLRSLPPREDAEPTAGESADRRSRAIRSYQEALDFIQTSITELESAPLVNQRRAKRVVHRLVDLSYEDGDGFSLLGLSAIKDRDHYTFNHMVNVCVLAIVFGNRLGLDRAQLAELGLCALYHDIGKLHVPLEVLNKPSRLSPEEWAQMGNHTVYAARTLYPLLVEDLGVVPRILAALQHHLGFDGQGYPALELLRSQTFFARVIAVVDLYDAMTTKRVYQKECLPDVALHQMVESAGLYLDPLLVKAFIHCVGIFPVGSTVELSTGEIAVVTQSNPDPERLDRPTVRLVTDRSRLPVEPSLVDLGRDGEASRRIVGCVDPEALGINSAHYAI